MQNKEWDCTEAEALWADILDIIQCEMPCPLVSPANTLPCPSPQPGQSGVKNEDLMEMVAKLEGMQEESYREEQLVPANPLTLASPAEMEEERQVNYFMADNYYGQLSPQYQANQQFASVYQQEPACGDSALQQPPGQNEDQDEGRDEMAAEVEWILEEFYREEQMLSANPLPLASPAEMEEERQGNYFMADNYYGQLSLPPAPPAPPAEMLRPPQQNEDQDEGRDEMAAEVEWILEEFYREEQMLSANPLPLASAEMEEERQGNYFMADNYYGQLSLPPAPSAPPAEMLRPTYNFTQVAILPDGSVEIPVCIGMLNGQPLYELTHQSIFKNDEAEDPYVKKPSNAFMIFMKEQRKYLEPDPGRGTAAIHSILGKKWRSMSKQEQATYYEQAARERLLHQNQHPNWSNGVNYGQKKKRERKRHRTHQKQASHTAVSPSISTSV